MQDQIELSQLSSPQIKNHGNSGTKNLAPKLRVFSCLSSVPSVVNPQPVSISAQPRSSKYGTTESTENTEEKYRGNGSGLKYETKLNYAKFHYAKTEALNLLNQEPSSEAGRLIFYFLVVLGR